MNMMSPLHLVTLLAALQVTESVAPVGELSLFLNTTSQFMWKISADPYVDGNILFSDYCAIATTSDGTDVSYVVGLPRNEGYKEGIGSVAKFRTIGTFENYNGTHLLIGDYFNHCIRWLNRKTNQTSVFAGRCQVMGTKDASLLNATFYRPRALAINGNFIYVADFKTHSIRMIDLYTEYVYTLFSGGELVYPKGLALDGSRNNLLVTVNHGILSYSLKGSDPNGTAKTNMTEGFNDGTLEQSRWRYPMSITAIMDHVYIVTDNMNQRVRIVDDAKNSVTSICMGKRGRVYANATSCKLFSPTSACLFGSTLYIGTKQSIVKIDLDVTAAAPTTPQSATTAPRYKLIFRSSYDVSCQYLSVDGPATRFVDAIMKKYKDDIKAICRAVQSRCEIEEASRACSADVLTTTYKTNQAIQQTELDELKTKIRAKQQLTPTFMRQTVISAPMPAVYPNNDVDGLALSPILTP